MMMKASCCQRGQFLEVMLRGDSKRPGSQAADSRASLETGMKSLPLKLALARGGLGSDEVALVDQTILTPSRQAAIQQAEANISNNLAGVAAAERSVFPKPPH